MIRRSLITSLSIIMLLLFMAGQAAGQKVRFATSVDQPMFHLPFMAAKEKGFWKELDIDVEWVPFRSGTIMYKAVAAGEVAMSMSGTISSIQAMVGGVPQVLVADLRGPRNFFLFCRGVS